MQLINLEQINELDFKSNESYKTLRTNIQFCGSNVKVICITSCLPNEGKSNVSFHLAASFAENCKKVVFIDADLRRSTIIGRYKPDQGVFGLSHYLSGQKFMEEVLYESNIPNLDIIFAGPVPPNPSELLGSNYFLNLLSILREEYDFVIIDTPPIGSVVDSIIVSKNCDGTILVIEANAISYKFAQKIKRQLEQVNSKILGAVLNKVNKKNSQYWNYAKKYKKYEKSYYTFEE
ncbi:MAG TPA: CpsD/CapB family tyrosine-protein kinase [Mobilitalea sp.]|nr:CpsD/CapB family tyrosine-protein kinase [Mobilitalea sp.]